MSTTHTPKSLVFVSLGIGLALLLIIIPVWLGDNREIVDAVEVQDAPEPAPSLVEEQKEIILIESVGDMLSLWEAGIKNSMVIFGLDVSVPQLNALIRRDPNKIIISLNNDEKNNSAGNLAAEKLKRKLLKYFDVKRKKVDYKTVIECVKDVKYIYWVKKDLFGCFRIEENVTKTMK